jgi:two-component system cell cycle sensor histidine kinase/response regulator CckA
MNSPASTGQEVILLVEDEPQVLSLTQKMLERQGYTIIPATEPEEAIRICEAYEGTIDLLITDVVMPTMNGKELGQRILALQPRTKILYMSGYTANVIAHRGVLDEGIAFIQKPFSVDALGRAVRILLDR